MALWSASQTYKRERGGKYRLKGRGNRNTVLGFIYRSKESWEAGMNGEMVWELGLLYFCGQGSD